MTVAVVNDLTSLNSQTPQGNLDTNGQVGYLDGSYGSGVQYIDNNYKIVHDKIQELGLSSESEGEDPSRFVVIYPS